MLGPVIGSLVGNYLVLLDWRWPFRVMTILIGLNTLAIVLCMEETYSSVLERKFQAELGGASGPSTGYAKEVFVRTFTRPPRMLLNPGIIYVFLVSHPLLFGRHDPPTGIYSYNWPAETVGLCYLGLGIGFLASALTAAIYQDRIYRYMSTRHRNEGQPEYRLIVTQLGMVIFPAGLLLWGWTAEAQVHWIVPLIGTAIFGYGLMAAFNSIQAFIVDAYAPYSAAAMAAATFMRSITGAVLPIFAPNLFLNLSYGKGATLLACVSLPAVPVPVLLLVSGGRLREKWKFKA
ncbi:hypothetical protein Rhopal_005002-T1 [Rhodotorula paludigena]|uniref:Major facilitator superfamily (MFS) profile domain-containing protein n=1 Tax=Rhodotorula paludigena TaxID=86838 RepID=A0AAV5GNC0_9BASI|nr:hypothetical protein Rhopal_005002-T1 [Rhodotorula paludigena]